MRRCKITVLKRQFNNDLAKQYIHIVYCNDGKSKF